jgi:hypothetical protein
MIAPHWLLKLIDRCKDESQLWLVLTALRGPDRGTEACKSLTTSRLRGLLGLQHNNSQGALIRDYPLNTSDADILSRTYFSRDAGSYVGSHFKWHHIHAVEVLVDIGYHVEEELVQLAKSQYA